MDNQTESNEDTSMIEHNDNEDEISEDEQSHNRNEGKLDIYM